MKTNRMSCTQKFMESLNIFLGDHGKDEYEEPISLEVLDCERDYIFEVISSENEHWELGSIYSKDNRPHIFDFSVKWENIDYETITCIYSAEGQF